MLKVKLFMRAGLLLPGAPSGSYGENYHLYNGRIVPPLARTGQLTGFLANRAVSPTDGSSIATSRLVVAPGTTSRIICACLRVAFSRPEASTQKYAGTHPKEDCRRDCGPRTRAESRAAQRAEEGCRHGRPQRER